MKPKHSNIQTLEHSNISTYLTVNGDNVSALRALDLFHFLVSFRFYFMSLSCEFDLLLVAGDAKPENKTSDKHRDSIHSHQQIHIAPPLFNNDFETTNITSLLPSIRPSSSTQERFYTRYAMSRSHRTRRAPPDILD